jgi:hypothetical protein
MVNTNSHPKLMLHAINRAARGVFAEWDAFEYLFAVCDDALWFLSTLPLGAVEGETRLPGTCCPYLLSALILLPETLSNAPRKAAALLACSASFLLAILDSIIGEANRLAISDPLHGVMTGAEVDALRLPLKKKLSAVFDLPSHVVTFRGILARLANAGQATLPFDVYRLFHPHPLPRFPAVYSIVYCGERGNCATDVREGEGLYELWGGKTGDEGV